MDGGGGRERNRGLGRSNVATRQPSTGVKVIKVVTPEGKMIMRLPSTGAKVIKMLIQMEI